MAEKVLTENELKELIERKVSEVLSNRFNNRNNDTENDIAVPTDINLGVTNLD